MECRHCEHLCGKDYIESDNKFFCCVECAKYFLKQKIILDIHKNIKLYEDDILDQEYGSSSKWKKLYRLAIFILKSILKKDEQSVDGFIQKWQEIAIELMEQASENGTCTSGLYLTFSNTLKKQKEYFIECKILL